MLSDERLAFWALESAQKVTNLSCCAGVIEDGGAIDKRVKANTDIS
jgi:hypothetical protein